MTVKVRGNPSPEQLAVVIALISRRSAAPAPAVPAVSLWSRPLLRRPLHPGPGAWAASADKVF